MAGYDAPTGTASVATTTAAAANRTIAQIGVSGVVTSQRLTDSTFDGGDARSVVSDGTQYWLGGNATAPNNGVRYVSNGSTSSIRLVNANVRDVNIFSNTLFYSTSTSVNAVSGSPPPTGGTPATTTVITSTAINGFVLFDRDAGVGDPNMGGVDTLYIADGANIRKIEYTGASWAVQGSVDSSQLGTTFGLTGVLSGSTVELYATDVNGNLSKLIDTAAFGTTMSASNAWGSPFNAGTNFTLRGVDFTPTPVPEPGAVLAVAAVGLGLARLRRSRPTP